MEDLSLKKLKRLQKNSRASEGAHAKIAFCDEQDQEHTLFFILFYFMIFLGGMGRGVPDFLNVPKVFKVFLRCSGWVFYSGMSSGFFRRCSWFSGRCSGVLRCSSVLVFRVPVFLELPHAGAHATCPYAPYKMQCSVSTSNF